MLAAEKSRTTFIAPVGVVCCRVVRYVYLSLWQPSFGGFSTENTDFSLCLDAYFTGGSLNPTLSFGPSAVAHDFPNYHYICWFGPAMGALLAGGYYKFVKCFNYEEANPGQ